jgi:TetR/AcrR family transcriptional repressor of nem operon
MGRPSTAKTRLLETACEEFSRVGAQATGVDVLCRKAGIHKGSFYHFFPSKSDLILKCLEITRDQRRDEVFEPAFAPDQSPEERMIQFFDRSMALQEKTRATLGLYTGCLFCTLGNELAFLDPAIRESVVNFMDLNLAYLTAAFSDAAERKKLAAAPEQLAEFVSFVLWGATLEVKIRQEMDPLQKAKEASLRLIKGIA